MSEDLQVGDWTIQPSVNRLRRGSEVVRLEPKVMQVLVRLAEGACEVVSREDLIARVWADVFVTDDVLHRAIRELRRIFGDSSSHPRFIETIRKRGYRLMVPAVPVVLASTASPDPTPVLAPTARPSGSQLETPGAVPGTAQARWPFSLVAAAVALSIAAVVLVVATRSSEVVPQAHARFVPVVSGPLNESDPALSPDGRRIAFVQREAGNTASADIYVRDLADERTTRITDHPASDRMPAWSPDGERLAFVRMTASSCDIFIRTLQTDAEAHIAPCGNPAEPKLAWTADGSALLIAQRPNAHPHTGSHLARLALGSGALTPLTFPPSEIAGDDSPVVSPDGRRVAFIRRMSGGVSDVHVVPIGGGSARRVTFDEADLTGVDWSNDGGSLVYSSDRAGGYSLWRVSAEGGAPTLLAGGAARMKHPVADRAARRVVYENWNYEINVWEVGLRGQAGQVGQVGRVGRALEPRPVTRTSELWNLYPQVSPDGRRLAFVSTQSGAHELWVADRDGGNLRQMTRLGRGAVKMPRWSPDGLRILYLARGSGAVDVQVVDVSTGAVTALTASPASEVAPSFSHDGARVLFGVPDSAGRWSVWSVDGSGIDRGPRVEIPNAVAAQPSPDGEWLYFTRPDQSGLWRAPAHDITSAVRVIDSIAMGNTIGWTVTSAGVYFLDDRDDAVRLNIAPLAGGGASELATLGQFTWPGFSVTPDGTHVLYARWDRRASNLMSIEY